MRLDEMLARVQEPEAAEVLGLHWEESVAMLGDAVPDFLQPAEFAVNREYCGFGSDVDPQLGAAARRIAGDPALRLLAWHCFRLLYDYPDYGEMRHWPPLERALGEMSGVFYLLVTMGMVPRLRALHRSMGVPDAVTRETSTQVAGMAENYRRMTGGRLGVTRNTIGWMRHHTAGRLFRIGRFEYMIQPFRAAIEVYRNRDSGAVIALAPDAVRFNGEGYVDGAAERFDTERGWAATLVHDDTAVTGYPIAPFGMAVRKEVRLPKATWECVLQKGDPTLEMHIPAGGDMTPARCGDSMRRAVPFFRNLFPERPFQSISCSSWIFNTQFEEITLSSDNLVRYQRELYLFPTRSSGRDGLWFIFLQNDVDPATAPRDTSLRRGVADFLAAGNTWRGGGMFFLTEHLNHFGAQYYRSHWPPAGLGLEAKGGSAAEPSLRPAP
jgi:hypothetical protein